MLSILTTIFWGLLTFSVIVFVHEFGHFIAARLCGVRVTDFYIGLPSRANIHFESKRHGTNFGITALFLGGYNNISGMLQGSCPQLKEALSFAVARGHFDLEELAQSLSLSLEEAQDVADKLVNYASIYEAVEKNDDGLPIYISRGRDAHLLTKFDKGYDRDHVLFKDGEAFELSEAQIEALPALELSHIYLGKSALQRIFMLIAGPLFNLILFFGLTICIYSLIGVPTIQNSSTIGSVESGSLAAQLGLQPNDKLLSINEYTTSTWEDVHTAVTNTVGQHKDLELKIRRAGRELSLTKAASDYSDTILGIMPVQVRERVAPADVLGFSANLLGMNAAMLLNLLNPTRFFTTINQASSVVGISQAASQTAAQGPETYLFFVSVLSLALGLMNLLPFLPLDGGKIVVEIIQAFLKRPLPQKLYQGYLILGLSYVVIIFIFALKNDLSRILFP